MTSYLKLIVSAAGAVALLASPVLTNSVLAKTAHRHAAPADARALAEPSAPQVAPHAFVTPYGADVPQPAHSSSVNPDFQVPGNNH
jgi:hypothetical protein